jgi:hypothetical protein
MDHKGWHSRGYLPHFDSQDTIQFVTYRLADSLPKEALARIRMAAQPESLRDEMLDRATRSIVSRPLGISIRIR